MVGQRRSGRTKIMLPKVGQSFGLGVIVNSHFPAVCPSLATLDTDATAMAQTATLQHA